MGIKKDHFQKIIEQVKTLIMKKTARDEALQRVCELLHEQMDGYDWVGFYLVDPRKPKELVLGPFVGDATEHTRIPFGKGICGQAAEQEKTFVVKDVSQEDNYIACSLQVKSEIVVPVFKDGFVVGQLDIDSHQLAVFDETDQKYLEKICLMISRVF